MRARPLRAKRQFTVEKPHTLGATFDSRAPTLLRRLSLSACEEHNSTLRERCERIGADGAAAVIVINGDDLSSACRSVKHRARISPVNVSISIIGLV